MRIVTVEEMRALEAAADHNGYSYAKMMEVAGRAIADQIKARMPDKQDTRVLFLIGAGNNGGDGLVAGRILKEETLMTVGFLLLKKRDDENFHKVKALQVPIIDFWNDPVNLDHLATRTVVKMADVIVDSLLGTGFKLPLRDDVALLLKRVKQGIAERESMVEFKGKPARILAVDLPSGMDADTGQIAPETLTADLTVTFEASKPGHWTYPGAGHCGTVIVAPLELPSDIPQPQMQQVETADSIRPLLPRRAIDANKYSFGKALIVAGSGQYVGAAALAAESAYRVGAGLVTVATPQINVPLLAPKILEATWLPLSHENGAVDESAADVVWEKFASYTAALIGSGFGTAEATAAFMDVLFPAPDGTDPLPTTYPDPPLIPSSAPTKKDAEITPPPLVIDADGLNLLAKVKDWWNRLPARTVLTPHSGEMSRLCGIDSKEVQANRYLLAREKAKAWNCVVVLKGANTIIADPDGRTAVIPVATPALARAGTGDVLAGAVCGYLAQGLDPFDAARVACYVHGSAGLLAAERIGTTASVLATDVLHSLLQAIQQLEKHGESA
ncbi:MAG: NAD(P)H-hydrate epimerase [Anaerolineae bacterium]